MDASAASSADLCLFMAYFASSSHYIHYQAESLLYAYSFAGRPGGPEFYISTVDNTENHGPGSQGSKTEADGCFAKIIPTEANINTVKRMQRQPGKQPPNGFIDRVENYIKIISLTLRRPWFLELYIIP